MFEENRAALPRTPWWFLLGFYLLSVVFLAFLAREVPGPLDIDGAYYLLVARNVAQGRGLVVDALWHFFHPALGWPQPAGDLWMPLPSLLMAPALLFGETFRYAQAAQILLAALLPLLAYRIAREQGANLTWATLAGVFTLLAGTVTVHWVDSDCYTAYALVGGVALYATGRAWRDPRWFVAGGLFGGLAALTRNDGVLLLAVLWIQALLTSRYKRQRLPWKPLLLGTALFLLPILLWGLRNVHVFGQPTTAPLTFFLTMRHYGDLFAYRPQPDWAGFWGQGWDTFLSLRGSAAKASWTVFVTAFQIWGLVPLLWTIGGLRRRPGLWPAFLYLLVLFLALSGAFPLLVLHGTWSRSLTAFLPAGYAGVALGLHGMVERLLRWRPALPSRLVHGTLLALAVILTVLVGSSAMVLQLRPVLAHPATWQRVGAWLRENTPPDAVVMAQDPTAILLYGERRAVGIPHEELPLLLAVAEEYGVSEIVLVGRFRQLLPEPLQDLYAVAASQHPFTLLWQSGEIQIYRLER